MFTDMPLNDSIFSIKTAAEFESSVLDTFHFQAKENPVYRQYLENLHKQGSGIKKVEDIPFLPIELFKSQTVVSGELKPEIIFTSSGTTGMATSKHYVSDLSLYEQSFLKGFEMFYGPVNKFCILALLPSYLERQGSSLIYMMDSLIKKSNHPDSGFYLNNLDELVNKLEKLEQEGQKTLLMGVSFALLDLAEKYKLELHQTIVMETGGMKGRRKEITREELHSVLKEKLGVSEIHSEYGMTELLSQAYSKGEGRYYCPPWMKVIIRDPYDPFACLQRGRSGGINIIDLANRYSCAFIETKDLGKINADGSFEVLGRMDNSDLRGCNLLVI